MKNHFVFNGQRMACYTDGQLGSVPPLVLVHGFCEDASVWDTLKPRLDAAPVVYLDLPGFGDSDVPVHAGIGQYADAICTVLNELNIRRAVLIGHSLGGYAALEFTHKYPERLAGLGLFHSHAWPDTPERQENRRRGIEMLRSGKKDLYVAQVFPGLFAPEFAAAHPEVVEKTIMNGRRQPTEGIINALECMMERTDHHETLRQAPCPVQFLAGDRDALIPLDWIMEMAHLPSLSDIRVLPGAGHMGMEEAPEACAAALREFHKLCVSFS